MPIIFEQKKFDKGEVSPSFYGRSDIDSYKGSVSKLLNANITEVGSVRKRPGFSRVSALGTGTFKLIPFQFNIEQAYVVVLGSTNIRIFFDSTLVGTVTSPFANVSNVKHAQSGDVLYLVERSVFPQRLIRMGHTDWIIEEDKENFWEYEVSPLSWVWGATARGQEPEPLPAPTDDNPDILLRFDPAGGSVREQDFPLRIQSAVEHTEDIVVAVVNTPRLIQGFSAVDGTPIQLGNLTITAGAVVSNEIQVTPFLQRSGPTSNVISGTVTSPATGVTRPDNITWTNRKSV